MSHGKFYTQLSIDDRTMIQMQLGMGIKAGAIALELGRSASTLSRELRRNGWVHPKLPPSPGRPAVAGGYRAELAGSDKVINASAATPRAKIINRGCLKMNFRSFDEFLLPFLNGVGPTGVYVASLIGEQSEALKQAAYGPNPPDDTAASELFDESCHARRQLR